LLHRLLALAGLIKPNRTEAASMVKKSLNKLDAGLRPAFPDQTYQVHVRNFKDRFFVFSARVERADSLVPYASGKRPLTILGVFDPGKRQIAQFKTINRAPKALETAERLYVSEANQHVPTPLDLLPF
jgi:hypothetical protein